MAWTYDTRSISASRTPNNRGGTFTMHIVMGVAQVGVRVGCKFEGHEEVPGCYGFLEKLIRNGCLKVSDFIIVYPLFYGC